MSYPVIKGMLVLCGGMRNLASVVLQFFVGTKVKGCAEMINRKRLLGEFFELIRIDSPTKNEREIADLLKNRLESMGLKVTEDNVGPLSGGNCGNVLAYLKGNLPQAPTVLLSAHMDTVDPCLSIEPVLYNGVITSAKSTYWELV